MCSRLKTGKIIFRLVLLHIRSRNKKYLGMIKFYAKGRLLSRHKIFFQKVAAPTNKEISRLGSMAEKMLKMWVSDMYNKSENKMKSWRRRSRTPAQKYNKLSRKSNHIQKSMRIWKAGRWRNLVSEHQN